MFVILMNRQHNLEIGRECLNGTNKVLHASSHLWDSIGCHTTRQTTNHCFLLGKSWFHTQLPNNSKDEGIFGLGHHHRPYMVIEVKSSFDFFFHSLSAVQSNSFMFPKEKFIWECKSGKKNRSWWTTAVSKADQKNNERNFDLTSWLCELSWRQTHWSCMNVFADSKSAFHRSRKHLSYNIAIVQNNTNLKLILQVPVPHQTRHTSYQIIDLHTPTTAQPRQLRLWEKTNSIRLCFASRQNKFCWYKQVQDKQPATPSQIESTSM